MVNLFGMKNREESILNAKTKEDFEVLEKERKRFNEGWYKGFYSAISAIVIGGAIGVTALVCIIDKKEEA